MTPFIPITHSIIYHHEKAKTLTYTHTHTHTNTHTQRVLCSVKVSEGPVAPEGPSVFFRFYSDRVLFKFLSDRVLFRVLFEFL